MDPLWETLPEDLRDAVRQRADPLTWSAMDQAEARPRRQLAAGAAPAMKRLGNLVDLLADRAFEVELTSPDRTLRLSRWCPDVPATEARRVLSILAPLVRRVVDVSHPISAQLQAGKERIPVARYVGTDLRLHPDYAHLADLQTGGFRARLRLLLNLVAHNPAETYLVAFERQFQERPATGLYKRKGDGRLEQVEIPLFRATRGYDPAEAFAWAAQSPDESAAIHLKLLWGGRCGTVASFQPPLFNLTQELRRLL